MSATAGIEEVVRQVVDDLIPGATITWLGPQEVKVYADGALVCGVGSGGSPREAVKLIADFVADGACEYFWGRAVPECPGHVHPAVMRQTEEGVAWVCPQTEQVVRAYAVDG